jgi:predicted amidohydrolase
MCTIFNCKLRQAGQGHSQAGEEIGVTVTFGVKIGLVISVDQRHGTRVDCAI